MFLQKHLSSFKLFPLQILPGGHMSRAAMQALPGTALGLVRKYIDKSGKKRMVGVPERLKSSQPLVFILDIKTLILSKLSKKMEEHFNTKRMRSYTPAFGQFMAGLATTTLQAGGRLCLIITVNCSITNFTIKSQPAPKYSVESGPFTTTPWRTLGWHQCWRCGALHQTSVSPGSCFCLCSWGSMAWCI